MEIKKEVQGEKTTLILNGRLDTSTAPVLEREINELDDDISLVFDMANLDYLSSVGLRLLLVTKKRYKDNFSLKNVKAEVLEVLEMTGFADIIKIEG
ncbi:MAG: STAS domain-containing protein [Bacilli bacterium]|nr:STAS domain-containing protein [Bacilli bacterium]